MKKNVTGAVFDPRGYIAQASGSTAKNRLCVEMMAALLQTHRSRTHCRTSTITWVQNKIYAAIHTLNRVRNLPSDTESSATDVI